MKNIHPKTPIMALLLAIFLTPAFGEDSIPPTTSPEAAHYEYLSRETQAFREFVEKERQEHRAFLEDAYKISGIAIGVVGILFTILGIKTIQDVKKIAQREYEIRLRKLIEDELANTEEKIQALRRLVAQEEMWINAWLRFIVPENVMAAFKKDELAYFGGMKPQFDVYPMREKEEWEAFNVLIHYFYPDEQNEDQSLIKLMKEIKGKSIPLIVYTHGLWIDSKSATKKALDGYQFQTPANNVITLLNNTGDAFRLKLNTR